MKRHIQIVCIVVGLFAWLGLGMAYVLAEVIYPVNTQPPYGPMTGTVTLSILKMDGVTDITGDPDQYPIPDQPVLVRLNGAALTSVALVDNPSTPLTTSRYPGIVQTLGIQLIRSGLRPPPFFQLNLPCLPIDSKRRDGGCQWSPCPTERFIILSSLRTAISTVYLIFMRINTVVTWTGMADIDTGPDPSSPVGDGIANIDEYRGFKVGNNT